MNITRYTVVLLTAFSLVFAGQAEAKHGSKQARSRVLKEMSKTTSLKATYSTVKKG